MTTRTRHSIAVPVAFGFALGAAIVAAGYTFFRAQTEAGKDANESDNNQLEQHYKPDPTIVQEIESLPLSKRLLESQIIFPFRPLLVPLDGSNEVEASDMFAFPGGVGLKKNSRLENPDSYEKQLIRGTTLYGKNRIEFAFQGYDPASNVLTKVVRFGENLCGHPGIVHGGLISAFFDDAFGSLFWINSNGAFTGVTANLTVNYRSPMPAPTNVAFILWLEREEGRKVFLKAEARSVAGQSDKEGDTGLGVGSIGASVAGSKSILFAEATALFIKLGAVVVNKT